jgi:hypothetical protein
MTLRDVLLPLFVEVILTFVLLFWMAYLRMEAASRGPSSNRVADAFHSQFELPVLLYVLTILAWDTRHAGTVFVALAWLFVLLQVIQAVIQVTDDDLRRRGPVFIVGAIVLAIMWGSYILDIVVGIGVGI